VWRAPSSAEPPGQIPKGGALPVEDPTGHAQDQATLHDALDLLIADRDSAARAGKRSAETVEFYRRKHATDPLCAK
jgi:hypothetical protein